MKSYDVIVVGGGPAGSTVSSYLAKLGYSVGLFERERYPRFHIGESLLPASMPILKETGAYNRIASGKYIEKFGARFVHYRSPDEWVYFGFQEGLNAEIPSAFEVERCDFDQDLLEHAISLGVEVHQPERVKEFSFAESHCTVVTQKEEYHSKYLVDATGRDALLGREYKMRKAHADLNNVAVFAHFVGVKRMPGKNEGDITVGLLPGQAWTWVIPFKGERTSVGVVCNSKVFKGGTDLGEYMTESMSASNLLKDFMSQAERCTEYTLISNYSHHNECYAGDRWIMIGDAAAFLDPIFSSGVHVGLNSARLASQVLDQALKKNLSIHKSGLGDQYKKDLDRGIHRFHNLISMFYGANFVEQMKKTLTLERTRMAFTSAVAGDVWNEGNFLFERGVL